MHILLFPAWAELIELKQTLLLPRPAACMRQYLVLSCLRSVQYDKLMCWPGVVHWVNRGGRPCWRGGSEEHQAVHAGAGRQVGGHCLEGR